MTIKPVIAPTQKRGGGGGAATDAEKKESHVHGGQSGIDQAGGHNQSGVVVRSGAQHRSVVIDGHAKSPQRRGDVYDELPRHRRRSPHKSGRPKRRDHHDHLKRERVEREKHGAVAVVNNKCASPLRHGHAVNAAGVVNTGGNSPVQVAGVGGKSPEHLNAVLGCQSPKNQSVAQAAGNLLKAVEDTFSGYNSGDEHLQPKEGAITVDEWQRRDEQFEKCMAERGYVVKPVEEDGACLFRSISLQIYGDEEMHDVIRQHTMDYIYKNREYYCHFVTEDINSYIKRKRRKDSHGNHIEIQAMSEIYGRPVEVYCYKPTPINIFNSEQSNNGYAPLRLSYQRGSHYNAILDPYNATVGVGLGLAEYKPELQTKEAVRLSEQLEIEQTMFEDKLKTTDWEATNEAIEEQIARESYLQWCRENLQKQRASATASTSATVTSAEAASDAQASPSKYSLQRNNSRKNVCSSTITAAAVGTSASSGIFMGNNGTGAPHNSPTRGSLHDTLNMPTKTLSAFAHNMKKDVNCDLDFESDDTDISSTSSIGVGAVGGDNLATATPTRSNKNKLRGSAMRNAKKRRREQQQQKQQLNKNNNKLAINLSDVAKETEASIRKSPKLDMSTKLERTPPRSPEHEQQPCTSKKSSTPEDHTQATGGSGKVATTNIDKSKQPLTSFYQELLEASYAGHDFGQVSESEMLQRAIQMSTNDYIEQQKRKYLYGP